MASQSWTSLINPASAQANGAGTALSTATTATISPVTGLAATADVAVVQASASPGLLSWYAGLLIRVTARGYLTTTGSSTTATWLLTANKGNAGTFTTLATSTGLTTGTGSVTGLQWDLKAFIRCTAVATSGNTVSTQGEMDLVTSVPGNPVAIGANLMRLPFPNITGETAAAIDTTQIQGIGLRGTLAGANATIQLTEWAVEALD